MTVDFHSHTTNSDGSLSTEELVRSMDARGVGVFSITDHDSVRAYAEMPSTRARVITGIEINTTHRGMDVHVLGYGFDPGPDSPIVATLEANRAARSARIDTMVAQLSAAGYPITREMVLAEAAGAESLGRPHVAKALIRAKLVRDVETAFRQILSRNGPGYVPSLHITPVQAIEAIRAGGGVPVLAHPGRLRDEAIIDELAEYGLAGLEVFYPTHTSPQVAFFRERARRYGLVMTAGSDFHDIRYHSAGVGMDVAPEDIEPFLALVA